jgi:hypothetical protein
MFLIIYGRLKYPNVSKTLDQKSRFYASVAENINIIFLVTSIPANIYSAGMWNYESNIYIYIYSINQIHD